MKRVKPKTMNGQLMTGEMLLELCENYTKSINEGGVPCIESAWSYICKNECQKAIKESIQHYELVMSKKLSPNSSSDDCQYDTL